ncbi:acyl-CoA dehydrogenase C-terminal domain-containing protein [Rhodoblastus acidophilus]|uniref:Acyl-CoA dehydrogenase C-terminal domain-containing protein n=1 Tax=Candidatus Rhodoblastus alkanivorans TaxID=2954117 RepID=A0ABS9Z537_9HYPH|nr:acyl-CoA dehydrogenase C-terminal domain-containing protein [Candidatus Rhodoblastus alkanivorans]MCI4680268.1 acyl-CoA dehydrogenase C-terminal domain-containing protein [Candidatus Rhodoblastus alkanivorans]MCI4682743.1 acyl-CoA dehydrogenase C-terminal domain-containing protein [Candidatus Rhodoblastus alkanivorans]MDI4640050.1 acyl-CoA dehydrogenase C-terminal domain-containing protein [Rhodoblastus acidophilus]
MPAYKAPLRDMLYVLYELMDGESVTSLPGFEDFSRDTIEAVLGEAAKLCEEVLQPINRSGDEEGCAFENGVVRTPNGFKHAYDAFRDGGWTGIACDPAFGGQGLPATVDTLVVEMICSANLSFGMYPGLSHGAYVALHAYGSDALKETFLPKLVDGTWSGTMCLTEPQCGTDLGLLRTRAVPNDDGSYKITGTKIFISAGEHDLTENIIHLVLARLPDAPKGVKGVSLFLVPKFLVKPDGSPGARNGVACGSIEHKMGIKASSTCVMNFDEAQGFLIGAPHKGMQAMFTMMNTERLAVGVQGLGLAEASYQGAVAYARERLQGRSLSGAKYPDKPADPLVVHPDIRRMLLTQRAYIEGSRALAIWAAKNLDLAKRHPDPAERAKAEDFVAVITPVVKALMTDLGFEATNLGMQVFGGHGYIRENGMEQFVRDARIAQIYEGANGVQALDLVGRKMPAHAGRFLRSFFHPVSDHIAAKKADPALAEFIGPLEKAFIRLQQATTFIAQRGMARPDEAGAAASDYLRLFGLTALAYLWAQMAENSLPKAEEDPFYRAKVGTARFFMERLLPQTGGLLQAISSGARTTMAFEEAAF